MENEALGMLVTAIVTPILAWIVGQMTSWLKMETTSDDRALRGRQCRCLSNNQPVGRISGA